MPNDPHTPPVIAIGASAGGLEALTSFFRPVPPDCPAAFFVIQHLSPEHDSSLDELLARQTQLPVRMAEDGSRLEPGSVSICPPGLLPLADGRTIRLEPRDPEERAPFPITGYFESLAHTVGETGHGVILSGNGNDGTEGVRQIALHGGMVFAQDPVDAAFDGMPQSTISTGLTRAVAPADQLWARIEEALAEAPENVHADFSISSTDENNGKGKREDGEVTELFSHLSASFGVDFSSYRIKMINRRIHRRMKLLGLITLPEYIKYLKGNEDEARSLYGDLLIGHTEFFRDPTHFERLAETALVSALRSETSEDFRIWVPGCATGQEAYSLYMLIDERMSKTGVSRRIVLFATDIFSPSLHEAMKGRYCSAQLARIGDERRDRYFNKATASLFEIRPEVREDIIFCKHDFLRQPPFHRMDLVSCRNVLIYLKPEEQAKAMSAFTFALHPGGVLFLGPSENLGVLADCFETVAAKEKIYRKQSDPPIANRWRSPTGPQAGTRVSQTGSKTEINPRKQTSTAGTKAKTPKDSPGEPVPDEQTDPPREKLKAKANQELKATIEELQAANEELQSMNEELLTLSTENKRTNEELLNLNLTHQNLLESIEDGVLYVDADLRIRRFNSPLPIPALESARKIRAASSNHSPNSIAVMPVDTAAPASASPSASRWSPYWEGTSTSTVKPARARSFPSPFPSATNLRRIRWDPRKCSYRPISLSEGTSRRRPF